MTYELVNTMVQSASQIIPTPMRECMKVGMMWPLGAAVGNCGSASVHAVADCWTCPAALTTQIVELYGLMLVHGARLDR